MERTLFFECKEHLYLLEDEAARAFKLGRGADVADRIRQLQCGNPNELKLICTWQHAGFLEQLFHRLFRGYRVRNEWYPADSLPVDMLLGWNPEPTCDIASLIESFGAAMFRAELEAGVLPDPWTTEPEIWENIQIPALNDLIQELSKGRDEYARRVSNVRAVRDAKLAALRIEDEAIYLMVERQERERGVANG